MAKEIGLLESADIAFRSEFFNLFRHPQEGCHSPPSVSQTLEYPPDREYYGACEPRRFGNAARDAVRPAARILEVCGPPRRITGDSSVLNQLALSRPATLLCHSDES